METSSNLKNFSGKQNKIFLRKGDKNNKIFHFYEMGQFVDVSCIVGLPSCRKVYKLHRLILAKESQVFENMLYNSNIDPEYVIYIPDIEPEIFEYLLNYIYTKSLKLNSEEQALKLYKVAHRYDLMNLKECCREILENNLNEFNVCQIYEYFIEMQDCSLKESCKELIADKAEFILKSESFININSKTVLDIIKQPMWIKSELIVFNALLRWGKAKCRENCSFILTPFMPYIHFLTFTMEEFSEGPAKSGVLSNYDVLLIGNYLLNRNSNKLPEWCNKRKSLRHPYKICSLDCLMSKKWMNWCGNLSCHITIERCDIQLKGIGFTADIEAGDSYHQHIPKRTTLIIATYHDVIFGKAKIKYLQNIGEFKILLNSSIICKKGIKYEICVDVSQFPRNIVYLSCENGQTCSFKTEDANFIFHHHGGVSENNLMLMNIHRLFYNLIEY